MEEIYVSTDIESNGPIPGPYSMWSLGSVALTKSNKNLGEFSRNLEDLPDSTTHPDTQKFWDINPEALEACRKNPEDPELVMKEYSSWLKSLPGKPVFMGYPAGYDFTFVYWYLVYFTGNSPFGFSCLDMKSYAMAKLGTPFRGTVKKKFPWKSSHRHTHEALDDAREQGEIGIKMINDTMQIRGGH